MKMKSFAVVLFWVVSFAAFAQLQGGKECNTFTEPVQGLTFFYLSEPAAGFDVLGTFKVKQKFTGEPKEQIATARKYALENYPAANGIIFTDLNMQEAKAIKIK